jgi:RHS repeat-associated protein
VGGVSAWYNLRLGWSVLNEESGTGANLYFAPYRFYNPQLARWMSRDPLGMVDGPNVYAYVVGNPLSRIDPLGLQGQWCVIIVNGHELYRGPCDRLPTDDLVKCQLDYAKAVIDCDDEPTIGDKAI